MDKKLIAISTNGSNGVSLVKSVNEQEYKKLINDQEKRLAKGEKLACEHKELHDSVEKRLNHYASLQCVLAKTIYDNFVDRGLIENDESFQQMWYDFYFNGKELESIDKAPKEYKDILAKVVAL
jgi:ASC-1-like (ASCH) protein